LPAKNSSNTPNKTPKKELFHSAAVFAAVHYSNCQGRVYFYKKEKGKTKIQCRFAGTDPEVADDDKSEIILFHSGKNFHQARREK
jgi:hypothetical protein